MDNKQLTCYNCGCIIDGYDDYEDDNGERICEDCFYDYFYNCDNCGDVVARDDLISIEGGREDVCASCANSDYYHCDACGEYVDRVNVWIARNLTICNVCSWDYCTCDDCGDVLHSDNAHCIDGNDYCDDCAPSHRDCIRDYNYKPTPIYYGEAGDIMALNWKLTTARTGERPPSLFKTPAVTVFI